MGESAFEPIRHLRVNQEATGMIMTRVDPAKLEGLAILLRGGMAPTDIRKAMRISRATYKRYRVEIRRFEQEARQAMRSDA